MKIIHCADLHLDSRMETNLSATQAKERKAEILNTFERMVDYAVQNDVTAIIIAGDMFDTAHVMNSTQSRVLNTITKHSQIDFLYLSGNHDETNFIENLDSVPSNLKIFGTQWTQFNYPAVNIAGIVLSPANHATVYDTLRLPDAGLNIVVMHGQIGQSDNRDQAESINLNKLKNKNIDYLALGHIHSYTQGYLDKRGVYCYAGCLEGRGFDECGDKGFVLLDIEDNKIQSTFVPFATRQLLELTFDLTPYHDWYVLEDQIIAQTKNLPNNALLKVVLIGKYQLSMEKHLTILEQKLNQQFYFAKIKDESRLSVNEQDLAHDISLRGEFIRQVWHSTLSESEKDQVITLGLKALAGEDL